MESSAARRAPLATTRLADGVLRAPICLVARFLGIDDYVRCPRHFSPANKQNA